MANIIIACALLSLLVCSAVTAHICDICNCHPTRYQVFAITCDGATEKHLHLTSSMMFQIDSTTMVTIKNFKSVSIERNSFSQLRALNSLTIQNCSHLYLGDGVFSNINSLLISNVEDLSFNEMALMGARGIRHIVINSSNMTELPIYSLYDIQGVDSVTFNEVNIGRIAKHALSIKAKIITIKNSMINYIDSNAVTLEADKILIKKSHFNTLAANAINITSHHETRLLENKFYGPLQLNITSPYAEIVENSFVYLNSSTVKHVQMPRIYSNTIYDSDLGQLLYRINHKDFYDNEFECRCGMNLRNATKNSEDFDLLKKNYCVVNNCTLSLMEYEMESIPRCRMHGMQMQVKAIDFCTRDRQIKTRQPILPEEERDANGTFKISPRFLAFDNENNPSSAGNLLVQKILVLLAVASSVILITLS